VTADLLIDSIDGHKMRNAVREAPTRFVVAPGRHEIGVSRHFFRPASSQYATVCIEAAAGGSYLVRPLVQADRSWTTVIVDTATNAPVATTCVVAPEPIVAVDGVAGDPSDAPAAVAASPAAVASPPDDERHRRDRVGSGFALRTGWTWGGEQLISGQLSDGDEVSLDAGAGATIAVAGTVTPLWVRMRRFGFGAGLELGIKDDSYAASNGRGLFRRFPLLITVHALARISGSWYAKLGGGIEKNLGGQIRSEGFIGTFDVEAASGVGPVAEIGLYRLLGRRGHTALEASLRYSRVHYVVGGEDFDGSGLGILLAIHFNP